MPEKSSHRVDKLKYLDVYIATTGEIDSILLGATRLSALVEEANGKFELRKSLFRLRTVTEPSFQLKAFKSMDWSTEMKFRKSKVMLCVIDGNCCTEHPIELFTIRAHHFPRSEDYPGFCITQASRPPGLAGQSNEERHEANLKKEFRCTLMEPTESAFRAFVQTLLLLFEMNDDGYLNSLMSSVA